MFRVLSDAKDGALSIGGVVAAAGSQSVLLPMRCECNQKVRVVHAGFILKQTTAPVSC